MGGSGDSREYSPRTPGIGGSTAAGGGSAADTGDTDNCTRLTFPAVLSSPEPTVVDTLVVGQLLNVVLNDRGGVRIAELQTADGRLAGTLTTSLPELFRCIDRGNSYVAEILSIDGGAVRVQVRNLPPVGCAEVRFAELLLASDEGVRDGQRLDVVLVGDHIVVRAADGEVIGTVTTNVERLLPCLIGGYRYVATVTAAQDGRVEVDIRPDR